MDRPSQDVTLAASLLAERMSFDRIPILDIASLRTGEPAPGFVEEIDWALTNVGFFYVTGHGVPGELVDRTFADARRFFDLPASAKSDVHISRSGVSLRGYTGPFEENTDPANTRDLKEAFDFGREGSTVSPFNGSNPWPHGVPGFERSMMAHLREMLDLGRTLLRGIACGLGLPMRHFDGLVDDPVVVQRILSYPSQQGRVDPSTIGIGAHTDYGLLTILAQDATGGLQVQNRDGAWVEAPPIPGTFVVNIGDQVQRLSNDRYVANLHRVINVSGDARQSIPFFLDPNYDAVIQPVPELLGAAEAPIYPPVRSGDHKFGRYLDSFPHLAGVA